MTRWCAVAVLAVASFDAQAAEDPTVATYTATYRAEYKGKEAGTAEFAVRYLDDRDLYEFSSSVLAKGLLKLARPNPAVERSHFRVTADGLEPLEFWYEDGSRSGDTPESLAARVHIGEHIILPRAVSWFAAGRLRLDGGSVMLDGRALDEPVTIDEEREGQ